MRILRASRASRETTEITKRTPTIHWDDLVRHVLFNVINLCKLLFVSGPSNPLLFLQGELIITNISQIQSEKLNCTRNGSGVRYVLSIFE